MRVTSALLRQHIGFMFKQHWRVQGKRVPYETGAKAELIARGLEIKDPNEYLKEFKDKSFFKNVTIDDIFNKPLPLDEKHPDYQQSALYVFNDSNVLVEGVTQAQVLLKTLVFDELPEKVEGMFQSIKLPADIERSFQQSVLVSHLLDAEQKKTGKVKVPEKPAYVLPRYYSITDSRKNLLLASRLLNHCERFYGHTIAKNRRTINDALFVSPFQKGNDPIQLELTAQTFLTSKKPISPFDVNETTENQTLPDLFPLKHTISIPKVHFYKDQNAYPINSASQFSHPHTILVHYSNLEVANIFETPVTSNQFESRAMLKGFAAAASRAQSIYGKNVKTLEKPIVVQVVQLDGKRIQFGIFQLNTLELNGTDGVKNYWFRKPEMNLYEDCFYNHGRPALTAYNFDIFRLMSVFYSN